MRTVYVAADSSATVVSFAMLCVFFWILFSLFRFSLCLSCCAVVPSDCAFVSCIFFKFLSSLPLLAIIRTSSQYYTYRIWKLANRPINGAPYTQSRSFGLAYFSCALLSLTLFGLHCLIVFFFAGHSFSNDYSNVA